MKILIIQQKMIGDVLTSTILFEAIKEKYPNSELHYLINSNTLSVVEKNPFIDKVILFTPEVNNSLKLWHFIKPIRKEKYDVVIDIYSKLSSNIISFFSKAKTRISYYKKYTCFLYTHPIKRKKHKDTLVGLEITNRLQLLTPLDIYKKSIRPKIYLTKEEIAHGKSYLESNNINTKKTLYMISVLGSTDNKTYPLEYMSKIIDSIVSITKGQILFNYIPNQESKAKAVYNFCKTETKKHIHFNVYGKNLREFLAITTHCDALIGNEGGAINMAKALNTPTFSIFSPWINKEGWNIFEDGKTHTSIHLEECKPELYSTEIHKNLKDKSELLYSNFHPEYIISKLEVFLNNIKQ